MSERTQRRNNPAPAAIEPLKLYWIAFNVALEPDVVELLETHAIRGYTLWSEVKGAGRSGPHLNDDVWPGVNGLYMFAAPAKLETALAAGVARIRAQFPREGIKLIVQSCDSVY